MAKNKSQAWKVEEAYTESLKSTKVNKTRGIKYAILEKIIKENLTDHMNIVELFAGAGINTGFVLENVKPQNLYLADISEECVKVLTEKFGNLDYVTIKQTDSFTDIPDLYHCDFLFLDSAFKFSLMPRFEKLFEALKTITCPICFTESEIYRLTFVKKELQEGVRQVHFKKLMDFFKTLGYNTAKIYYCSSNCYLLLNKEDKFNSDGSVAEVEFIEYTEGSDKWRKFAYGEKINTDLI